jgi:hypothetical protein
METEFSLAEYLTKAMAQKLSFMVTVPKSGFSSYVHYSIKSHGCISYTVQFSFVGVLRNDCKIFSAKMYGPFWQLKTNLIILRLKMKR